MFQLTKNQKCDTEWKTQGNLYKTFAWHLHIKTEALLKDNRFDFMWVPALLIIYPVMHCVKMLNEF